MSKHYDEQELPIEGLQEYFDELSVDSDFDDFQQMRNNIDRDLYDVPKEFFTEWVDWED